MKYLHTAICLALLTVLFSPNAFAARQIINGADQNYGDTGNPAADGARFSTDNVLSTTADAQNFGAANSITVDAPGGIGTLTCVGSSAITGNIATGANHLKQMNANGAGDTITIGGNSFIDNLNFGADGTVSVAASKNFTGNITTSTDNTGTLTLASDNDVNGNIGSSGAALKIINANGGVGSTTNLNGDVFATTLNFGGDGIVRIADGNNLNAAVTTTAGPGTGTLVFRGATTTGGDMGALGAELLEVRFTGVSQLGHDIWATNTNINAGNVTIGRNTTVTGDLTLSNNVATTLNVGMNTLTLAAGTGPGKYTQRANSRLLVGVAGTTSGSVAAPLVNGTLAAGSFVDVMVNSYVPNNTAFKIVDTLGGGGVNVPTITSSSPMYTFTGAAAAGDLTITATRANTYNGVASSSNGAAAGAILESVAAAGASGDMLEVINALDSLPTTGAVGQALDTLVPEVDAGALMTMYSAMNQFINASVDRIERTINFAKRHEAVSHKGRSSTGIATGGRYMRDTEIWAQGFGDYAHQDERGASNGYNATVWGTALGADLPTYYENITMGISGGYAQSFIRSKDNSARTDIDSYQISLYGGYQDDEHPYYMDCVLSFALNDYSGSRHITFGAIDRTAQSDYLGQQYSAYFEYGYSFSIYNMLFTPNASIQYMHLHTPTYTETNAGSLNLKVNSQDYDMVQLGVGPRFEFPIKSKYGYLVPEVHAKWLYDFVGDKQATTSTFSGGGGSFATNGFTPAQSTYNFGGKLSLFTKANVSLDVNYDFQVKEDYYEHTGWASVSYKI